MPKRVRGICPDCGQEVSKRHGKLMQHNTERNAYVSKGGTACIGSGKRVPTSSPGPRKGKAEWPWNRE